MDDDDDHVVFVDSDEDDAVAADGVGHACPSTHQAVQSLVAEMWSNASGESERQAPLLDTSVTPGMDKTLVGRLGEIFGVDVSREVKMVCEVESERQAGEYVTQLDERRAAAASSAASTSVDEADSDSDSSDDSDSDDSDSDSSSSSSSSSDDSAAPPAQRRRPLLPVEVQLVSQLLARWIDEQKIDVNSADELGKTALIEVSTHGLVPTMRWLIERGADVNVASHKDGVFSLIRAAQEGHTEAVKLLLERGAHVNQVTSEGVSSLQMAAQDGYTDIVRVLLEAGADPTIVDNHGDTALSLPACQNMVEIVRMLLAAGADATHRDADGASLLYHVAGTGAYDCAKLLLEHGAASVINSAADVDFDTVYTCLQAAAVSDDQRMVRLLLEHGADPNQAHAVPLSPLMLAFDNEAMGMVDLLLRHGAKLYDATMFVHAHPRCVAQDMLHDDWERGCAVMYRAIEIGATEPRECVGVTLQDIAQAGDRGLRALLPFLREPSAKRRRALMEPLRAHTTLRLPELMEIVVDFLVPPRAWFDSLLE